MSTAVMEEKKRLIIQEIQLVEEEWILKAIEKLLDMDEMDMFILKEKAEALESKSRSTDNASSNFALTEDEWVKIEQDEEDFKKGKGANYSWKEVRSIVLNDGK